MSMSRAWCADACQEEFACLEVSASSAEASLRLDVVVRGTSPGRLIRLDRGTSARLLHSKEDVRVLQCNFSGFSHTRSVVFYDIRRIGPQGPRLIPSKLTQISSSPSESGSPGDSICLPKNTLEATSSGASSISYSRPKKIARRPARVSRAFVFLRPGDQTRKLTRFRSRETICLK